jgi:hypothetical protein
MRVFLLHLSSLLRDSTADEAVMVNMVRNGSAADCDFVALPDAFYVWDLSFGYSHRMPRSVIEEIDRVLLQTQDEDALFDRLQMAHINMPNKCEEASKNPGPTQITMTQVRRAVDGLTYFPSSMWSHSVNESMNVELRHANTAMNVDAKGE